MSICRPQARAFIILCFLAFVWLSPARQARAQVISAHAGYVTRVEGEAWVRRHGATELSVLQQNTTLARGDVVLTGDNWRVELTLTPGSYLQVGPQSQVWVYVIADDRLHFDILRGEVAATVAEFNKSTALSLDTPSAELHIVKQGRYVVRVAVDDATDAYVEAGELRFVDAKGESISLHKHKHVRFAAPAWR